MKEYEDVDSDYNELQEYLNHQESWLEAEMGETYYAIKGELEDE